MLWAVVGRRDAAGGAVKCAQTIVALEGSLEGGAEASESALANAESKVFEKWDNCL
jgi:hypothetical protein